MAAIDYFPQGVDPRPQQIEALAFAEWAFAEGYQDVILELPTGSGKSFVAAALCRWAKDQKTEGTMPGGYTLVVQKALQDQMAADLDRFASGGFKANLLKSATEYPCPRFKRCGLATKGCPLKKCDACPYKTAKQQFLSSVMGVTNYAYFITDATYQHSMDTRQVLVLDEVHNLARVLGGLVGIEISQKTLEKRDPGLAGEMTDIGQDIVNFMDWLQYRYLPATHEWLQILEELNDKNDLSDADAKMIADGKQEYLRGMAAYKRLDENADGWVYWHDVSPKDGNLTFICRPIDVDKYFNDYFGKYPRRVYMSAFIGNKSVFCHELGLDPKAVAHFKVPSDFKAENRRVIMLNCGSLSYHNREQTLPKILRVLVKIAAQHADECGVIHTHSYAFANAVVKALADAGMSDRVIYPEKTEDRDDALKEHATRPNSIFVSPSVFEGYDFRDDLARWQILLKCPYASLSDKVVKAKSDRSYRWYQIEALKTFLQTCGRACRSKNDFAVSYCLDADAIKLLEQTKSEIPPWFLEAIEVR